MGTSHMTRSLLSWTSGALLVISLLTIGYFTARGQGVASERGRALAAENERLAAISLAVGETVARANALAIDVERLRSRPERVRTVTKEIRVEADADCRSLPLSWGLLWNAEPVADPSASAAPVADDARLPVAGD